MSHLRSVPFRAKTVIALKGLRGNFRYKDVNQLFLYNYCFVSVYNNC